MKVGILGGGQLGLMLIEAGKPLGLEFLVYSESSNVPAARVAPIFEGEFTSEADLKRFSDSVDFITYEWENLAEPTVAFLKSEFRKVFPAPETLRLAQDRWIQKEFFKKLQIPTAPYQAINQFTQLQACALPGILKTRRWGYDGKGQWRLQSAADLKPLADNIEEENFIFESLVKFDRELSIVGSRDEKGQMIFYPLVENEHEEGILRVTWAPAERVSSALQAVAEKYLSQTMKALNYRGTATLELFQVGDKLLVNEFASRVHNSGHWTIEGADRSQFENHLRAGLGLGLKAPILKGFTAMLNLISWAPEVSQIEKAEPKAKIHLYGKSAKPGRKLGHLTVGSDSPGSLKEKVTRLRAWLSKQTPE